jgi:hypothetical protein
MSLIDDDRNLGGGWSGADPIVPISFSPYRRRMDAVDREELIGLLSEALMRDAAFRPRRRHWAADADRVRAHSAVGRPGASPRQATLQRAYGLKHELVDAAERQGGRGTAPLLAPRRQRADQGCAPGTKYFVEMRLIVLVLISA